MRNCRMLERAVLVTARPHVIEVCMISQTMYQVEYDVPNGSASVATGSRISCSVYHNILADFGLSIYFHRTTAQSIDGLPEGTFI